MDTQGFLLCVDIQEASLNDNYGGQKLLAKAKPLQPRLSLIWCDCGYQAKWLKQWAKDELQWTLQVLWPPRKMRSQTAVSVANDDAGNFVAVWQSEEASNGSKISAQRFDASGNKVGGEFQVNQYNTSDQLSPHIVMNSSGQSVIVWQSSGQDGDDNGVYARRYDASGNPIGNEFRVNDFTVGAQNSAAAALRDNGEFIITWTSTGQDGSGQGVYAKRYSASGLPL